MASLPQQHEELLSLGTQYLTERKYPQAIEVFSAALAQTPNDVHAVFNRGTFNIKFKKLSCFLLTSNNFSALQNSLELILFVF